MEEDAGRLNAVLQQRQQQLEALQPRLAEQQQLLQEQQEQAEALQESLEGLKRLKAEQQQQLAEQQQQLAEQQQQQLEQTAELQASLDKAEQLLGDSRREVEALQQQLTDSRQEMEALRVLQQQAQGELAAKEERSKAAEAETHRVKVQAKRIKGRLEEATALLAVKNAELAALREGSQVRAATGAGEGRRGRAEAVARRGWEERRGGVDGQGGGPGWWRASEGAYGGAGCLLGVCEGLWS